LLKNKEKGGFMRINIDMYSNGFYFAARKKGENNLLLVRAISFDREEETKIGKLVMYTSETEQQSHRMGNIVLLSPLTTPTEFVKFFPEGKENLVKKISDKEITTEDLKIIFPNVLINYKNAIDEILEEIG
jgi:hypothetical protein